MATLEARLRALEEAVAQDRQQLRHAVQCIGEADARVAAITGEQLPAINNPLSELITSYNAFVGNDGDALRLRIQDQVGNGVAALVAKTERIEETISLLQAGQAAAGIRVPSR